MLKFGRQFGKYLNTNRLQQICNSTDVSVPVALGILQHFGVLDWRQFAKFKEHVKERIPSKLIMG